MKCTKCGNEDCFDVPFIGKPKCVNCGADYEADTGNEYEKCVFCGKETEYLISTHVDFRYNYTEAGQLCKRCS